MTRSGWLTAAALAAIVALIVIALLVEAGRGPTFRPEDYASYQECVRNIPPEWGAGTLQRSGAEDACAYVHRARR